MADVINPAYLSMPAQVQKNKDDIEALRESAFVATLQGQYSASTTYGKGALVAYTDGNIYYHFSDTETQGVPPTDSGTWVLYQEGIAGPQGEQGIQGNPGKDGVTPNISASATVTNTTGTPTVNVTKGGTAENPSFAFAFQNLKGEPGAQGTPGTPGADGQGYNDMGTWTSGGEYHPYDVVTYSGTAYNCTQYVNGSSTPPPNDSAHWEIFASGGLPALTFGGTAIFSTTPLPGTNTTNLPNASFNRTPEVGDRFLAFSVYSTNNYICGLRITSVGSPNSSATVETYISISVSKHYMHYIQFQTIDANNPVAYITCMLINESSAKITNSESLIALLANITQNSGRIMATGVLQIASGPPTNGYIASIAMPTSGTFYVYYYDASEVGVTYRKYPSTGTLSFGNIIDIVTPIS